MTRFKRFPAIAVGLALTMGVAACGGGTQGAAPAPAPAPAPAAPAAPQAPEPVDFGGPLKVILSSQYNLPLIGADAADYLGLFDAIGLEVELIQSQDGTTAIAAGDADIDIASPNRHVGAILAGLEATIVGPTVGVWDQLWIVRSDTDATTMSQWKGGKVGISRFGSAGHFSAVKVAETLGFTEGTEYEIVTMGNLDGLIAGLENRSIDAFAWSAQAALRLEQSGAAKILGHVADVMVPAPLDTIAVSNRTIAERPHAVRAFCEAYYEGQRVFKEDQALATKVFIEAWGFDAEITPGMVAAGAPYLSTDDSMTDEMLRGMAEATMFTIDGVGEITVAMVKAMYTPCSQL
jgi:ABC-type nitrate/sulfonate/bicarbonate transport system substrate-binding protein